MPETDLHRDLGRIEGRLEAVEQRVARNEETMEKSFRALDAKLDAVAHTLDEIKLARAQLKGGWWVLSTIATGAAAAGSLVTWMFGR